MARKGILNPGPSQPRDEAAPDRGRTMPRGAVGALQSSLSRLQENAVQDVPTEMIDEAGFEDRLSHDPEAHRQLVESLQAYGQQVPVLLRPHSRDGGRYEIVYGRRRLRALKELGVPVRAIVRQLDDHALALAQGQENTSRQDLSFVEKASFAAQLQESGYDRQTIVAALSTDLPMLSRMLKVGTAFDLPFLRRIGSAPGIGRDRWLALVKLFADPEARARAEAAMETADFEQHESDGRFEMVFARARGPAKSDAPSPAPSKPRTLRSSEGETLGEVRRTARGVTLAVTGKDTAGFSDWLDAHAQDLLQDLHDQWRRQNARRSWSEDTD